MRKSADQAKPGAYDVIVVGAGASGVGMGALFEKCGFKNYCLIERDRVGASFRAWPKYTRFISPSFAGNAFNAVDLNAVTPDTAPAFTLRSEHPTSKRYAEYLQLVAKHFAVKVQEGVTVGSITKQGDDFHVETNQGRYTGKFVIWAGGEFGNPVERAFPGAELGVHTSRIERFPGDEYTIIGGFESGMELAVHLLQQGKRVQVIDAGEPWNSQSSDSSISLAPSTWDRLRSHMDTPNLRLRPNARVSRIERAKDGFVIILEDGKRIESTTRPILATGFQPLPGIVRDLFMSDEEGNVLITDDDESTITPGLFLVGPRVRHGGAIFCFIYKFRQRWPIVAETIGKRLGVSFEGIEEYKKANMYLKDLSCCTDECAC